ncbi:MULTISPECIES: cystathionine gamma-synthase [Flavobacterium]|jgi:cystathionine beta-lyase/cystathionine gamma-synthase|uniref:Cystathionine gamma-synthase n=1 Tax=Flavobacterium tructae TaxID=1114873 RepID=A0A1S1JB13_9FLAO|nr:MULTISPECIES: cystathionine gamma-synthase [Flavobacterium]MDL2143925.1 cystathionine gamma-synthase [Flavobacterium tructae]OHT46754.1 cystathionine gamma-synthase [Flavobacterium tructae]OXB21062.1 cystathionine gamma-synthase [Flavobacterium tructae]OXB23224.1 cystathionine gamma-synthase [Flavobacterium tructae]URC13439.1 cystathionine gamma-synthase [Flavobacterium sp. B183]
MKFNTKVIHGGQHHDPATGAVMPPVYQTSTFIQTSPGKPLADYEYSRASNPTRTALENALASIENGTRGLAFSSGLAATDCILRSFKAGDEIIAMDDLYGGTYRMFSRIYKDSGIKFHFVDMTDIEKLKSLINENTKLIWVETPTNPLMKLADIQEVAKITKANNILFAVDNTFATPYLQKPLDLGADIVMHSATKYLGGHSDVIAGALIVKDEALGDQLHFQQFATGATLGPMDSFLVLRGIKTLSLRVQRHCENGEKVVQYLSKHPKIDTVYYPGLESHPFHEIAKKQMKAFGGMVSFTFKSGKKEDSIAFLEKLKVFTLAESLGGVESLANHPALMTHASIPADKRAEVGITDDLVRLSVGIEDAEDLIADLEQALA